MHTVSELPTPACVCGDERHSSQSIGFVSRFPWAQIPPLPCTRDAALANDWVSLRLFPHLLNEAGITS